MIGWRYGMSGRFGGRVMRFGIFVMCGCDFCCGVIGCVVCGW